MLTAFIWCEQAEGQDGDTPSITCLSVSFLLPLSLSLSVVDVKFTPTRWHSADYEPLLTDVEQKADDVACGLDTNCLASQNGAGWQREIDLTCVGAQVFVFLVVLMPPCRFR